ncbi:TPA: hypothetical protein ACH3X1_014336 [Trebouxia sp. C0004]
MPTLTPVAQRAPVMKHSGLQGCQRRYRAYHRAAGPAVEGDRQGRVGLLGGLTGFANPYPHAHPDEGC